MAGERILVVDDNPTNVKLLSFLLSSRGYQVESAGDAEEALRLLEGYRPDLILMDIQLPGMDGLALTRRLRAEPATRDVVIVAVTAHAMRGDEDRALEAGCDGFITKPVDTRSFPATIAEHLARRRAPRGGAPP
ncbi:MAG TPA: response regulator [Kofleriaceae bacterium]|nr:response regulator [Kofleriaceae bacterium]